MMQMYSKKHGHLAMVLNNYRPWCKIMVVIRHCSFKTSPSRCQKVCGAFISFLFLISFFFFFTNSWEKCIALYVMVRFCLIRWNFKRLNFFGFSYFKVFFAKCSPLWDIYVHGSIPKVCLFGRYTQLIFLGQVSYCHYLASVVRHKLSQKSSSLKTTRPIETKLGLNHH